MSGKISTSEAPELKNTAKASFASLALLVSLFSQAGLQAGSSWQIPTVEMKLDGLALETGKVAPSFLSSQLKSCEKKAGSRLEAFRIGKPGTEGVAIFSRSYCGKSENLRVLSYKSGKFRQILKTGASSAIPVDQIRGRMITFTGSAQSPNKGGSVAVHQGALKVRLVKR